MNNFKWIQPRSVAEASAAIRAGGAPMGGGIELLCLLKERIIEPVSVVNLKSVSGMRSIETGNVLKIGALATVDSVAENASVKSSHAALAQAAEVVASPQIRNVGTVGGNLCQRPRCWYFRDPEIHCLKKGGQACFAVAGNNEYHAILGGGPCHIVHPSDLAPALMAFDSVVVTNERRIPIEQFFVLPKEDVSTETVLKKGEVVIGVETGAGWANAKSAYYKAKERPSFDWALASCAVALKMTAGKVTEARVVLGGVAPIPWRSKEAEAALVGKNVTESIAMDAGVAAMKNATPMSNNAYKVKLAANVVKIAVLQAAK